MQPLASKLCERWRVTATPFVRLVCVCECIRKYEYGKTMTQAPARGNRRESGSTSLSVVMSTTIPGGAANAGVRSAGAASRAYLPAAYQNTYRLQPDKKFPVEQLQRLMTQILEQELTGLEYDAAVCSGLAKSLAATIKNRAKTVCSGARFKLLCKVVVGQNGSNAVNIASRCLWNEQFDSFAECSLKNQSVYASACFWGFYCE